MNRAGIWVVSVTVAIVVQNAMADDRGAETYFESHVRPLLVERCVGCHGAQKQSGGLRLDSRAGLHQPGDSGKAAVAPGNVDGSLLIQAVRYSDDLQMPPDERLTDQDVRILEHWVRSGAEWPEDVHLAASGNPSAEKHWAFQPVSAVQPPAVDVEAFDPDRQFIRNPIDAFIARGLIEKGLPHSPPADSRTMIRRVTAGLTGLLPSGDDVAAFEATGSDAEYEQLVDRLLASPAYGEQWARHWLDVARYSDTKGYVYAREERFWIHAWAYRDWVVHALNADMPYDRFLLMQIVGDQVSDRDDGDLAAMGFLTVGRRFLGVQRDIYDDRIDVVTRGTMSLTVGCARCHDHKYDPIPTADYYSLYGVFASSREKQIPLPSTKAADEGFRKGLQERIEKLETTRQQRRETTATRLRQRIGDYLQAQFELGKYPEEGFDQIFSANDLLPSFVRRWQARLREAALTRDPVFTVWHVVTREDTSGGADRFEIPQGTNPLVVRAFSTPPTSPQDLAARYATLFAEVDQQWTALCQSASASGQPVPTRLPDDAAEEIRQVMYGNGSPCVVPDEPIVHTESDFDSGTCTELWKLQGEVDRWIINAEVPQPWAVILEDREVPTTPRIFRRGDPAKKGDEVPRQFLQFLSGADRQPFRQGSGRYELAQAIIDPNNPLTARVIVNRVWAHHFGTGLVSTPGDFGLRADAPSHPELLDWLANWFVREGWSLKKLHRLIVMSGTYRQTSTLLSDPAQQSLADRTDPDNRLLWRMNAHRLSFEEMRDAMLAAAGDLDLTAGGKPTDLFAQPFPVRRTLYGLIDRQFLPGTLRMFDFANPDLHIPERSDTIVPQQALFLMNHPSSLQIARHLADHAAKESDSDVTAITRLYQRVFQRHPTPAEKDAAGSFLAAAENRAKSDPPVTVADWSYGYGFLNEQTGTVEGFTPLPHFTGNAWQGGAAWPDAQLGWVQLTAVGGHPGNDRHHASIRRWTAPAEMSVRISTQVVHDAAPGDGIRTFIVSSAKGLLQSAQLHQNTVDLNVESVSVTAGETIDFICDIGDVLNSDQHQWRIQLIRTDAASGATGWNSEKDFTPNDVDHLTALQQLAQILLCSNEFLFVD
ncbi:MAG: PSD1 domain-containing protein [Planctomycetaceae bacterium]|nr:PSD1 domain-containing protein [Planctomycetaceae bacterium]